jgi:hypothetical protein
MEEIDGVVHSANREIGVPGAAARREGLGSIVEFSQAELQKAKADPSQRSG